MPPTNHELKKQARRLRVEGRLSYKEITDRTGVPQGTLSAWLRDIPLTTSEIRAKQQAGRRLGPYKDRGVESKYSKRIPESRLTKVQKARLAEAAALFRLLLHGAAVFGSPFDGDVADWVIEVGASLKKVQVKWAQKQRHGLPLASLQRKRGHRGFQPYQEGDFDFLVVYDYFTDTCYVWSWGEVQSKTSISIRPDAAEAWDKVFRDE